MNVESQLRKFQNGFKRFVKSHSHLVAVKGRILADGVQKFFIRNFSAYDGFGIILRGSNPVLRVQSLDNFIQ
jgi:hypothetical protein